MSRRLRNWSLIADQTSIALNLFKCLRWMQNGNCPKVFCPRRQLWGECGNNYILMMTKEMPLIGNFMLISFSIFDVDESVGGKATVCLRTTQMFFIRLPREKSWMNNSERLKLNSVPLSPFISSRTNDEIKILCVGERLFNAISFEAISLALPPDVSLRAAHFYGKCQI